MPKQKTDTKKRDIFKSLTLLLGIQSLNLEKKNSKNLKRISEIIGTEVKEFQIEKIRQIIKNIRSNFTSFSIEDIINYLYLIPEQLYERLPVKIKKAVLFSTKLLTIFPYYCDGENWGHISYTGRAIGRPNLKRYNDPVIKPLKIDKDEFHFDICIVGSGAGGSLVGLKLCEKYSVGILEKGRLILPSEFTEKEDDMIPKLYRLSLDNNLSIITVYGNAVGGSTVHNTALFVKLPEKIYERWSSKGLPIKKDEFYELQNEVFSIVKAEKITTMNTNNLKVKEGIERLGLNYFIPDHSRKNCLQVGFCELGCYWNRKFSTLTDILPEFQKKGGAIIDNAKAIYIERSRNKVKHILFKHREKIIKVRAKKFIISAGAISSPILLRRSKILDPQGVCLHPSTYVMGIFEEEIYSWIGIPISLICLDFLREDGGFVLMPYALHPGTFSIAVSGKGKEHHEIMRKYKNIATIAVMLHDKPKGHIEDSKIFKIKDYYLDKDEVNDLKKGIFTSSEILFESGAKEVLLPSVFQIQRARNKSDVQKYLDSFDIYQIPFISVHPQATIRWHEFLESDGRIKGLENIYVADTSVFPESCGVPPQATAMSISIFIAKKIISEDKIKTS
ncbi:Choline dehydrogenase [Candidatus Kryptobacter tengchongensis]|nr:Choline dehydrogenase [Candidatus Kryptobacter tengchongensis]